MRADGDLRVASPQPHRDDQREREAHAPARSPRPARRRRSMPMWRSSSRWRMPAQKMMEVRPRERRAARASPADARDDGRARERLAATRGSPATHAQQQRNADEEQQRAADPVQDRDDRRQRQPDRDQVEIDRARLDGRSFDGGHRISPRMSAGERARRRNDQRMHRRVLLCAAANYSASRRTPSARTHARALRCATPQAACRGARAARSAELVPVMVVCVSCRGRAATRPGDRRR